MREASTVAGIISRVAPWKRLYVVPVYVSQEPMYQLVISVKSRNGIMLKHVQGTHPFPESKLPGVKQHLGEDCVIDQRLDPIYLNERHAQLALDAGKRVRIAMEPFQVDPALVRLARELQAKGVEL